MGMDMRSREVIIGTPSWVVKARSVRRRPEDERWDIEKVLSIRGTPDDPTPGVAPGYLRAPVIAPPDVLEPTDPASVMPDDEPGLTGRRVRLLKDDFVVHGYTPGCSACVALEVDGSTRKGHNEVCRKRMEDLLVITQAGRDRVEEGYSRIAEAALRI